MATYQSDIITAGNAAKVGIYPTKAVFRVTLNAPLATNDVIELTKIPANCEFTDFLVDVPEMDTNNAATISYELADDLSSSEVYLTLVTQPNKNRLRITNVDFEYATLPHQYLPPSGGEGQSVGTLRIKVLNNPATPQTSFPQTLMGWAAFSPR